ncbi:MAG: sigma-70 family RNA polymerase sigma factor [Actinomycetota bacterium]|nr:sigma-70 family RNA polymerase sigma factor [Actinomycetota bacterium]
MTPLLAQRPRADRAFERLYKRHVGDVYRYALAVMRNPTDAEDVTQTTFLNAYRSYVEKGSRPEKPQNWLIAIAHNVCRQRFRQSARRPAEVSFEDDIADTVADDDTPTGDDIRRALSHLAFNQRAALVMRELEGRSYAEIAEILELSTSAVETLIFRARRALREQLEGSLTCGEAEFSISRQLDGRLPRGERGQLRAHLRECTECAGFARRQRAQRGALKTLALVPVPGSLMSLFGGGSGAAVGTGLTLKAAAAVTAGLAIGGASYEGVHHVPWHTQKPAAAAAQNAVGAVAAPRDAALSPRGPSRVAPAASATHGHAVKSKNVRLKKGKKAKTHGRASQTGSAGHGRFVPHGNGADRARHAGGARLYQTVKLKPRRLRLPGPIGERPAPRHVKKK